MLLTSSQVSVAVSSGVVIMCTSALFFSGYVIQQRTLRDLRLAIKEPRPAPPKIFLPDRFKQMTTELEDGTVVVIQETESEAEATDGENSEHSEQQPADAQVRPDVPAADGQSQEPQDQAPLASQQDGSSEGKTIPAASSPRPENPILETSTEPKPEVHISRAERRRRIKEEIRKMSYNDKPMLYQRRLY